jgi:hypothetical protein
MKTNASWGELFRAERKTPMDWYQDGRDIGPTTWGGSMVQSLDEQTLRQLIETATSLTVASLVARHSKSMAMESTWLAAEGTRSDGQLIG